MIAGVIHEFPGFVDRATTKADSLVIREADRVRTLVPGGATSIAWEQPGLQYFALVDDTLWIEHTKDPEQLNSFSCYSVSLTSGKRKSSSDHPLAEGIFANGLCAFLYYHDDVDRPYRLRIVDVAKDRLCGELEVPISRVVGPLGKGLYGVADGSVWGATWAPKLSWTRAFETNLDRSGVCTPIVTGDLVIAAIGELTGNRNHGLIVALDAATGRTVWEVPTAAPQGGCRIEGDNVLAIAGGRILKIDARSGRVLIDVASGFATDGLCQTVQGFPGGLVAVAPREQRLRLYTEDAATVMQELRFPIGYMPRDDEALLQVDSVHYLLVISTTMNRISHGLLELQADGRTGAGEIVVPPWPVESIVLRLGTKKRSEEYLHIGIREAEIEDVLRYGEIALQSRLNAECLHRWSGPKKSGFNGRILFSCNVADSGGAAHARVAQMVARVNQWSETLHMTAPSDRKTSAQVELVPMSEFERKAPPG